MLIDQGGNPKGPLGRGERKSLQTDRVVLVLGPEEEQVGDSALLFLEEGTQRFRPMTQKGQNDCAVILPLTPSKLLVGEKEATVYDFAAIKRAAVLCSLEFFLGHENSAENQALKEQIGTDAAMLSDKEIEEIAVGCFVSPTRPKELGR